MLQIEKTRKSSLDLRLSRPGLPPGIRQSDCDGRIDPLAEASPEELWQACDDRQQLAVAGRFAFVRADDIRDVLLDAELLTTDGPEASSGFASIGKSIWRLWISHRNRAAREFYQRGELRVQ